MDNLAGSENNREKLTDLFYPKTGQVEPNEKNLPDGPPVEKTDIEKYLFTPRSRSERRAEAFLEEWVRRFSRA